METKTTTTAALPLTVAVSGAQYSTGHEFELELYLEYPHQDRINEVGIGRYAVRNGESKNIVFMAPAGVTPRAPLYAFWYTYRWSYRGETISHEEARERKEAKLQRYCSYAGAASGMTLQSIADRKHDETPIYDEDGTRVAHLSIRGVSASTPASPAYIPPYPEQVALDIKATAHRIHRRLADTTYRADSNITPVLPKCVFDNVRNPFGEEMPMWVFPHMAWQCTPVPDTERMMQAHFVIACMVADVVFDPASSEARQLDWWTHDVDSATQDRILAIMHCLVPWAKLYVMDTSRKPDRKDASTDSWVAEGPHEMGGDDCESLSQLVLQHISMFRRTSFTHPVLRHMRKRLMDGWVTLFSICAIEVEEGMHGYHVMVWQVDRRWLEFLCGKRRKRPASPYPSKLLESTSYVDHNRLYDPTTSLRSTGDEPVPSRPRIGTDEVVTDVYKHVQLGCPMEWDDGMRVDFLYRGCIGAPVDAFARYDVDITAVLTPLSPRKREAAVAHYTRCWPSVAPLQPSALSPMTLVCYGDQTATQSNRVIFESFYRYTDWDEGCVRTLMTKFKLRCVAVFHLGVTKTCRSYFVRGY
jgi:hypothetical protein